MPKLNWGSSFKCVRIFSQYLVFLPGKMTSIFRSICLTAKAVGRACPKGYYLTFKTTVMSRKNSNLAMFLAGLFAGGATVYYLKSPRGQKMVKAMGEKTDELKQTIVEKSTSLIEDGRNAAANLMENASQKIATAREEIVEKLDSTTKDIDNQLSEFEKGVTKAKKELKKA